MGKTCEPKAFSFHCMTKFTTNKKKKKKKNYYSTGTFSLVSNDFLFYNNNHISLWFIFPFIFGYVSIL